MIPSGDHPFNGIYPATICPFKADHSVDEEALAQHFAAMLEVPGNVGILCNGHAGENFLLSREEKRRNVEIARATIGDSAIVVAGVNCESSLEAVEHARDAVAAGADSIMVFAPYSWAVSQDDTMAANHHRMIADAIEAPIMLYQGSVNAGQIAFRPEVLAELVQIPGVVAIKDGSWEVAAYEANRRLIKEVAPDVAVMGSGDEHLFTSYVIGSEGSLVSLAIVIPEIIVALYDAFQTGDMEAARGAHATIYPLARAIYGTPPGGHATARLKTCLKLLGRLENDRVRPPIGPLAEDEVEALRGVLAEAGLR